MGTPDFFKIAFCLTSREESGNWVFCRDWFNIIEAGAERLVVLNGDVGLEVVCAVTMVTGL